MGSQRAHTDTRGLLYQVAGIAFAPPTPRLQADLFSGAFTAALQQVDAHHALGLADDVACLEFEVLARPETLLTDLQAEYVRLFVSSAPTLPAPPYGSYYLDGTLRGQHADDVLRAYAAAGWTLCAGYRDLPDHVAAELEFLWRLAGRRDPRSLQTSLRFLELALLGWLPRFNDRVQRAARHPFYRTLAAWTAHAVDADAAWLRRRLEVTPCTNSDDATSSNSRPARSAR